MIFVTLGSQKFQFNRLLRKIDELIKDGIIKEEVFAQSGYCDYKSKFFKYKEFLDREEFATIMEKCDIVITHGGTGTIIGAVKKGKKVIAVPRLAKYGEHVDDHQIQLLNQFNGKGVIRTCYKLDDLGGIYEKIQSSELVSYKSNTRTIIDSIDDFLKNRC